MQWSRGREALEVELPEKKPGEYAYVLELALE
jgi:hypothetical protein